ncbi:hypothetical protein JTE90_026112 [Oedothorax gibbosus]|uniref:Uncharacterized protein n=1 Tax=Oedothorax gibbosus TaxID=931172 RepID=A0AAV6TNY9_9ARAC|nr:hypothetical protein JTE90_026112 [Oedothorax gibbosus]
MSEYELLGHMSKIEPQLKDSSSNYFMPHFSVNRESCTTTKHRVVINGSSPTSNGLSVNSLLGVGPQSIVWREDPASDMADYELNTVTYGLSSSSFLATRCLEQIAAENKDTFSEASFKIENNFYMDDLLSGSENLDDASLPFLCLIPLSTPL